MFMKRYLQKGFGTVQWMALTGGGLLILMAYVYGWPAYQDYQVQSQVSEVFMSADACRAEVSQIVQKTSATKLSTSLFGCDGGVSSGVKISRHLKSIAVGPAGAITVTLDYQSLSALTPYSNTLTLIPLAGSNSVLRADDVNKTIAAWRCGSPGDGTTIPSKYLPSHCRD
jgi:type IV pilus assembly protein PilA